MLHRTLAGAALLQQWRLGMAPDMAALRHFSGTRVHAMAGIARPERFFTMLEALGIEIARLPLPDHHDYAAGTALPWPEGTADVLVTEKDAVKLRPERVGAVRVWVVALDCQPGPGFDAALRQLLPPRTEAPPQSTQPAPAVSRPCPEAGTPDTDHATEE